MMTHFLNPKDHITNKLSIYFCIFSRSDVLNQMIKHDVKILAIDFHNSHNQTMVLYIMYYLYDCLCLAQEGMYVLLYILHDNYVRVTYGRWSVILCDGMRLFISLFNAMMYFFDKLCGFNSTQFNLQLSYFCSQVIFGFDRFIINIWVTPCQLQYVIVTYVYAPI